MSNSDNKAQTAQTAETPAPGAGLALWLLLAINLFNYIDRQILSAVVPQIREEFFKPDTVNGPVVTWILSLLQSILGSNPQNALIGLLAMAFMVTYMLAAPVLAGIKLPKWSVIAIGVILWSLASGATGLATGFGALLLTRCFLGLGEAAFGPVAPSLLSDLYPLKMRGRVMSWFYLAIPVGSALGFVLGGTIAASALGWRWAFYLVVPPGILLGLLCLVMRWREGSRRETKAAVVEQKTVSIWKSYGIFLRTPTYVLNTLAMAAMTFAVGGIGFWMPSYIHEYRGQANLAQVNMIFGGILVVSGLAATVCGGWLADKLRDRHPGSYLLVSGIGMLVGFPCSLAILWLPFPYAWIAVFAACFCLFFNTGPANTAMANVVHPSLRPSAFALNILVIHALGDVISPLIVGAVADAFGGNMNIAFMVVSVTVLIGGVLWLWGARYLAADTAKAETNIPN
ncbi:MAG: MFS transporter [Candidatus Obscuribacterales bacterium]|nr:MFS transporter [Candidatus Obscuribacterales bacterium]